MKISDLLAESPPSEFTDIELSCKSDIKEEMLHQLQVLKHLIQSFQMKLQKYRGIGIPNTIDNTIDTIANINHDINNIINTIDNINHDNNNINIYINNNINNININMINDVNDIIDKNVLNITNKFTTKAISTLNRVKILVNMYKASKF
jgi:hypothetical protein